VAIKGKGKTKGRQVARAPRREPVRVKPPFFTRRWVQLVGSTLAGAAVVLVAVWVTHGLSTDRANNQSAKKAATRLAAAKKWESAIAAALTPIVTGAQAGPPSVLPALGPVLTSLAKGTAPSGAAHDIKQTSDGATTATTALTKFDLSGTLSGQGFTAAEVTAFLGAQQLIIQGVTLYGKAADVANTSLAATGGTRKEIAVSAQGVDASATAVFGQGWNAFIEALSIAGVNVSAPAGSAGLPSK
jgi:hypothetical protein